MSERRYYNDGLDDDGFPLPHEPWRKPYAHGCEADAGEDFAPITAAIFAKVAERAEAAMRANARADSPIEAMLGGAIILRFRAAGKPLFLCMPQDLDDSKNGLLLVPQFKWSIYRSDWAIYNTKTTGALLIECDGKEFHSSPEQIEHDRRKDAAAHDRGYLTMRFSGASIHHSPDNCADRVYQVVYGGRE